jgi:hypothetical protein
MLVGMGKMVKIFRCPAGRPIQAKRVYKQLKQARPPDERPIRHVYREPEGYIIDPGILVFGFSPIVPPGADMFRGQTHFIAGKRLQV